MNDYVVYGDTDSLYLQLNQWLIDNGVDIDKWEKLDQSVKIDYVKKISKEVENYVNEMSFNETQLLHYNSQVNDFSIVFEQEKIALSGVFATKKRYATWTLLNDGKWKDEMSITGMEIIRSDSPEVVKPMIKHILELILKGHEDVEISDEIERCKTKLKTCRPDEIAENKGINKLDKYKVKEFNYKKGAPHQVKGAINYHFLLDKFNITGKYEMPMNGNKAKVVYLQKNPFGITSLSFMQWPEEFEKIGIKVDYKKMIENNFTKKIRGLLEIIGKEELCNTNSVIGDLFS